MPGERRYATRGAIGRLRTRVAGLRRRGLRASLPRRVTYSATRGLSFDDADLESRLVWILGSPRTGSTWLVEQLCDPLRIDHSGPIGFSAPGGTASPLDALPVNEFLISSHIAPALGEPIERDGSLVPATLNNYLGHKAAYLFATGYAEVWRPEVRRLVLVRLQATLDRARARRLPLARSPLLVVKEVNGSHAADVVMSLLPRSRLLFLVRDGRDVVDSMTDALGKGAWLAEHRGKVGYDNTGERLAWVGKASREWACDIDATQRAYDAHAPDRRRTVRYEDLIADPGAVLRELFAWLELARGEEQIERIVAKHDFSAIPQGRRGPGRKRRSATPGLWRENLTDEEQATIQGIMGPRLERLGYAP